MTIIFFSALFLLLFGSAFCSSTEVAFFSLPASRIKAYRFDLDVRKRQIARLLQHSKNLLVTIFLLNTIAGVLLQNLTSDLFDPITSSWLLKVLVPLIILLIFGELLPKYLGLLYADVIAPAAAPFYEWFQKITEPFRRSIITFANFFSRLLFFFLQAEKPISKDELDHILETSEGRGILLPEEADLISGYLELDKQHVHDLMTPRNMVQFYSVDSPLSKLIYLFSETKFPEIPVCQGSLDALLGMMEAKTYLLRREEITEPQESVQFLIRPLFVPETASAKWLLQHFDQEEKEIALVVDEYGATNGFVTKQQLIQALSKHMSKEEPAKEFSIMDPLVIVANGTMPLQEINDHFDVDLKSEYNQVTLGGYLTEKFGTIPENGQDFATDQLFFRILAKDSTRILKVYIKRLEMQKKENRE